MEEEVTIAKIAEKMVDYSKSFTAMEDGSASLADAKMINDAISLIKPYLDAMQSKASGMLRARENIEVVLSSLSDDKKKAVLAIFDGD